MIEPRQVFKIESNKISKVGAAGEGTLAEGFDVEWTIPENLPYFDGHFPGHPVLPAVAIMDASVEFLRRAQGADRLKLTAVSNAKFVAVVSPGMTVHISLRSTKGSGWNAIWNANALNGETPRLLAELNFSV